MLDSGPRGPQTCVMSELEGVRDRVLTRLRGAYVREALDTRSFEWRVDAALRCSSPAALRQVGWDLARPGDAWELVVARACWFADAVLGREHPKQHVLPVDLALLAGGASRGRWIIGRAVECDVSITVSRFVSARHAELSLRDGRFRLRDLRSTNGVWIGGRRVEQALVDRRVPVSLGDVELRWR